MHQERYENEKGVERLLTVNGFLPWKKTEKNSIWRHKDTHQIIAVKNKQFPTDNAVREDEDIKPDEAKKITLNKNKSKVTMHPVKKIRKEDVVNRIKGLIKETLADHVGQPYSQEDYNRCYNDCYSVLNDSNAPSSLKDLAYKVANAIRFESHDFDGVIDIILEKKGKKVSDMDFAEKTNYLRTKDQAKKTAAANPAHYQHIIDMWDRTSKEHKEEGMNWYEDAHHMARAIANDTGNSLSTVSGLIANYSPQTNWHKNIHTAAKVARTKIAVGGPIDDDDDLEPGESRAYASRRQKTSAHHILYGRNGDNVQEHYDTVLKGHKVRAFAHLIEFGGNSNDQTPKVCVDRHALSVATGRRVNDDEYKAYGLQGKGSYEHVAQQYVLAARELSRREGRTIHPHQLQAATWLRQQHENKEAERQTNPAKVSKTEATVVNDRQRADAYISQYHPQLVGKYPGSGYSARTYQN